MAEISYVPIDGTDLVSCSKCGVVVADEALHTEEHAKPTLVETPVTQPPRPPSAPSFPVLPPRVGRPEA